VQTSFSRPKHGDVARDDDRLPFFSYEALL
jgi:hypothetical protein